MTQNNVNNEASDLTVDNLFLDGNDISSLDTNGDISLSPDGTGTVSITAAPLVPSADSIYTLGSSSNSWDTGYLDGVSFDGGTNVMETYVAGTSWTPVIEGATTAGVGTYTTQEGRYSRIGKLVQVTFSLNWTAHTGTGFTRIGGIPYAPSSLSGLIFTGAVQWANNVTYPANVLWGQVLAASSNSTQFFLQFSDTSGDAIGFNVDSSAGVNGSLWYFVD